MRSCCRSTSPFQIAALVLSLVFVSYGGNAQQTDATSILTQMAVAFSENQTISKVQLSGTAIWYAGRLEDSGSVTLTASAAGDTAVQLSLAKSGSRTESQSAFGPAHTCDWAGNDGVSHEQDFFNCLRPVAWFLPTISLQPTSLPAQIGVANLGTGTFAGGTYVHLRVQAVLPQVPTRLLTPSITASTTDIGVDPATILPSVLRYKIRADNGSLTEVGVEIHYSDYRTVNGVKIPFHISRYINGSLQLDVQISSAQIG